MADYELSVKADQDLTEIYIYSYSNFGETKADSHFLGLEQRFLKLAENPNLGIKIDYIREGCFRYEYVCHSIFYKQKEDGILVMRILHGSMDVGKHL
ncbi:MAG: type II toxin-antitoxin system RelE/ParE family toxin [Candidatus Dadabacteria bacterium]|nr:type II toxin-antitoxin system RelE/ParE family toxin [Candidatus Dadabacteria bacterium]NIS09410.1 type II toxin-antitoxin system RelE/ParE family toxin [Candidatus Dadabacteria bacterium]NIV42547.1 type II toxin-antitoxin system RelE/ParE family toxin [Candidatus Dadabacteria bacterium]NIY22648.1 type II toxin-antitoxin system RelE/ParE family toxin [Candidatus Dadabacteria bacterium]